MTLSLDIETVRHPDVPAPEDDEERCPAAPHHRIVAAAGVVLERCDDRIDGRDAYAYRALRAVAFGGDAESSERSILEHLARAFTHRPKLVTFNGSGFDLRVIAAAALEHGLQIPWLFSREVSYRYSTDGHEDVMDTLSAYGAGRRARQDAWARRIGLPGKTGVDGSDVAALVEQGRIEELRAYNLQDAGQLTGIWLRKEYVSGRLTLAGYQASARSLVSMFEATPMLKPIVEHERFDRARFLMEGIAST